MDLNSVEINSERLKLVPITLEFTDPIFHEFTPEVTSLMFPKPAETPEDTKKFISDSLEKLSKGDTLQTVILDKQTGEFLGCEGLHSVNTSTPELGIWIKSSAWGKGIGKEAITALKEWADKNVEYKYIKYPVDKRNIPSKKIPESLGGVVEDEYSLTSQSGKVLDLIEYRIYPSVNQKL